VSTNWIVMEQKKSSLLKLLSSNSLREGCKAEDKNKKKIKSFCNCLEYMTSCRKAGFLPFLEMAFNKTEKFFNFYPRCHFVQRGSTLCSLLRCCWGVINQIICATQFFTRVYVRTACKQTNKHVRTTQV
jgi:hypothetical protein